MRAELVPSPLSALRPNSGHEGLSDSHLSVTPGSIRELSGDRRRQ